MGKKNKGAPLGRSLIKDRFTNAHGKKFVGDKSMLHTTEIPDGYDWGRLNLQSVTEESSFQEFLSTAELAGTEFQAEKLNIKFVNPLSNFGLLSKEQTLKAKNEHEKFRSMLKVPRRPPWNAEMTAHELDVNEKEHFLEWRRNLAMLQEEHGCLLTPYEKNLEFWRQLWRVIERSDVIVQIVDARNPLLFRCEDLEQYVKEVSENKLNLLLINKADFLTVEQRKSWADYLISKNINFIFFSALLVGKEEKIVEENEEELEKPETDKIKSSDESDEKTETLNALKNDVETLKLGVENLQNNLENLLNIKICNINSHELINREQLIEIFRTIHTGPKFTTDLVTIGLVGYPNVGKSSTINALMANKKVSVSATPGKTKHFQTLFLDKDILLCDCPGLVMPTFVFTKAEMVVNGILPIDQMRDHVPPVSLVCQLIPKHVIEDTYGIILPLPVEGEDPDRAPFCEELLNAYGFNRGFMTSNGQPDNPRSARYVLKDFVNGKLLYCHSPPNIPQEIYHTWPERKNAPVNKVLPPRTSRAIKINKVTTDDLDKTFFKSNASGVHAKGTIGKATGIPNNLSGMEGKPWKKINKHANKNKKEKLRRIYSHLDEH